MSRGGGALLARGSRGVLTSALGVQPNTVANLAGWWKADAITGLADAAAVSQWDDASGNTRHVAQATGTKQPTYRINALNGRPVVRFDGGDLLVFAAAGPTAAAGTIFVAAKPSAVADGFFLSSGDEAVTTAYFGVRISTGSKAAVQQRNADTADQIDGDTVLVAGTPYVLTYQSSGTAYSLRVNGTTQTLTAVSGANSGDWFGDTPGRDSLTLGALKRSTEASFFSGDLAELIVYDRDLSSTERHSVERYLGNKYGIST